MEEREEGEEGGVSDRDIIRAIKMLEGSEQEEDISKYKASTRKLFEQLLLKLEENSDLIYTLEHRVKFLEQECEDKETEIEKMSISMQEAVNDCRQEAEEMVAELMGKMSMEVKYRQDVEGLARRLQAENAKLKDYAVLQKLPGFDKCLSEIIKESTRKETLACQQQCETLRESCKATEEKLGAFQLQREAEMNATLAVIKFAHDKIETLHMQLKIHQQREVQEQQLNGSNKKWKKNKASFSTPQKDKLSTASSTPSSTPSPSDNSLALSPHAKDKALYKRKGARGKKNSKKNSIVSNESPNVENCEDSTEKSDVTSSPKAPDLSANGSCSSDKEEKITPELLVQKSKSFWGRFQF